VFGVDTRSWSRASEPHPSLAFPECAWFLRTRQLQAPVSQVSIRWPLMLYCRPRRRGRAPGISTPRGGSRYLSLGSAWTGSLAGMWLGWNTGLWAPYSQLTLWGSGHSRAVPMIQSLIPHFCSSCSLSFGGLIDHFRHRFSPYSVMWSLDRCVVGIQYLFACASVPTSLSWSSLMARNFCYLFMN
jgi:hypothetical protein